MKKALVVLLILAVAGGVFAQVTFSGYVRGGIAAYFTDNEAKDAQYFGNRDVAGGLGTRVHLNASWTHADGNAGLTLQLRGLSNSNNMESGTATGNAFYPHLYFGWFKALDGMVKIIGGKIDDSEVWGTAGGNDDGMGIGTGMGMNVSVYPIDGLALRVGAYPLSLTTDPETGVVGTTLGFTKFATAMYNFGARYLVPDVVDVIFIYQSVAGVLPDWEKANNIALGFKVLALKPMGFSTVNLDFGFYDLTKINDGDFFTVKLGQKIEYTSGDLLAGIRFLQQLRIGDTPSTYAPDLAFTGFVQYLVNGTILPRLDFGFDMGTGIRAANAADLRGNWDGTNKGGFLDKASNFVIQPSCSFRFGSSNQRIDLGYALQMDLSDPKADGKVANQASMRNTVYVSYYVGW